MTPDWFERPPFPGATPDAWITAIGTARSGRGVGFLERSIFLAALWGRLEVVIAGYLALKVAAKWAGWQHILKLPEIPHPVPGETPAFLEEVAARDAWGSWIVTRFIVGTLFNVACAIAGYGTGKLASRVFFQ